MNDPIQQLVDDHINLSIVHRHFREQLERFQFNTSAENLNLLIDIVDYLKNYPECHHHALEDKIYNQIRLRIDNKSLIEFLDQIELQHSHMRILSNRILGGLMSISNDQVVNKDIIVTDCNNYLSLYEDHIHNENTYLLPNIESYLSEEELAEIGKELEQEHDPLFSAQREDAYNHLFLHITSIQLSA